MYRAVLDRRNVAARLTAAGLLGHAFFLCVSIAGTQISLAIAAAGTLLALQKPRRTALDAPIAAFVLVAVLSDLVSPYGPPPLAFATLWRPAIGYFVVAQGLALLGPQWRWRFLYAACAGLALASAVALLQYRTGIDVVHLFGLRAKAAMVQAPGNPERFAATGFFVSRLGFGHTASMLLALAGGALAGGAAPRRWILSLAGALGLAAVGLTFDRAAYLGLAVAALVIALQTRRKGAAAVIVAIAAAAFVFPGVRTRLTTPWSTAANGRLFIWARAADVIRDHPLRGVGFGNYQRVLGPYYDRVDPNFPMRTWAHNLELTALAEMGPLGLCALAWLFVAALRALWRSDDPWAQGGLAALCAWLTIAQAHDLMIDTKVMYALWFALAISLTKAKSKGPSPARAA